MNEEPMLPHGVLTRPNAPERLPINWERVRAAFKTDHALDLPLSRLDKDNIERAAWRYRQELNREGAGDSIRFGKLRERAGEIAETAEKLRALLADPDAPSLVNAGSEALARLQAEAANIAKSETGGSGSKTYSFDLRKSLMQVMAGRWRDAGGEIQAAAFYRASGEVLRQAIPYAVEGTSQEQAVRRFVREFKGTETTS